MKSSMTLRLVSAGLAVYLGSPVLAHAQNQNIGFFRTTLAIGTVSNRMVMEGEGRGLERGQPGGAEAVTIQASKRLNPDQKKEIQAYTATILQNGHSNWHSHPGLEMDVNPATGHPVTFYYVNRDGSCRKEIFNPGQSHLIMPGEVHVVINESGTTATSFAVLRVHTGDSREFLPVGSSIPNPDYVPITLDEPQPLGAGCVVI